MDDKMFTLNTVEVHSVAYRKTAHPRNPEEGQGWEETEKTDTLNTFDSTENRTPTLVVDMGGGKSSCGAQTVRAKGPGAICCNDKSSTIGAHYYLGCGARHGNEREMVTQDYIVRRLTPRECGRLQGMPDWWVEGIAVENPTEEDMSFWRKVWDTYCDINGTKRKTDNQIKEWLKAPRKDADEYKMWGNGVALPCALYIFEGFAKEGENND